MMRSLPNIYKFISTVIFSFISITTVVHASNFALKPLADISNLSDVKWQKLVKDNKSASKYWLVDHQGLLYSISDGEIEASKSISLHNNIDELVQFNDLVLHPSFSLSQQANHLTFYTSHTEQHNPNKNSRLLTNDSDNKFAFDLVITKWKFSDSNTNGVESSREVMRVAAPTKSSKIENLHFEPYKKSWADDYGLLYFTISAENDYQQHPFFSGSLHRIQPERFGLKQFTIPNTNPFITNDDLYDSLLMTGQGTIKEVHWFKGKKNTVLLTQKKHSTHNYFFSKFGSDNRSKDLNKPLFSIDSTPLQYSFLYHNGNLKSQRNSLLILHKEKDWVISSHDLLSNKSPEVIWHNDDPRISDSSDLSLYRFKQNQSIVLHDKNSQVLLHLEVPVDKNNRTSNQPNAQLNDQSFFWTIFIVITFICLGLYYVLKQHQQNVVRNMLRKQFARFELSENKDQINLFRRHESEINKTLNVADISKSIVMLNNEQISLISSANDSFSNDSEQIIKNSFANERRHKMVDDKTRKVDLQLTINNEDIYNICLYLRKGNQRLTKPTFDAVLETILNWQWFVSKKLHNETEERIVKVAEPRVYKPTIKQTPHNSGEKETLAPEKNSNTPIKNPPKSDVQSTPGHNEVSSEESIVDALNKLANLKQQGHLTIEEFNDAKSKLLKNLTKD